MLSLGTIVTVSQPWLSEPVRFRRMSAAALIDAEARMAVDEEASKRRRAAWSKLSPPQAQEDGSPAEIAQEPTPEPMSAEDYRLHAQESASFYAELLAPLWASELSVDGAIVTVTAELLLRVFDGFALYLLALSLIQGTRRVGGPFGPQTAASPGSPKGPSEGASPVPPTSALPLPESTSAPSAPSSPASRADAATS